MFLKPLNHKGFSAVEALLILVIVGIIGGTGYYVYHANSKANDSYDSANSVSQSNASFKKEDTRKETKDETANWRTYVNKEGVFSVKYPSSWVQPSNPDLCGDILKRSLQIGPDAASVMKCGSDGNWSQISVSSIAGDSRDDPAYAVESGSYENIKKSAIKISGVTGTSITAKAIHQQDKPGIGGMSDGTVLIRDIFYAKGNTYIVEYVQQPGWQDQQEVFNLLVNTLKFE